MAETRFFKFHGAGNDFILIDDRDRSFPVSPELIRKMCDRHFGIGADGLILLRKREGYDFVMVYFNSDGKESSMCGNGGRCSIALADFLSLVVKDARFLATDGEHHGTILHRTEKKWQIKLKMSDVKGVEKDPSGYLVNTGSPHLVKQVDSADQVDVFRDGKNIRNSGQFALEGVNVNFVEWSRKELYARTYERGVENETLSCGTGATAAALAYAYEKGLPAGEIIVRTRGGRLTVSFRRSSDGYTDIWLEGPAELVFYGTYLL